MGPTKLREGKSNQLVSFVFAILFLPVPFTWTDTLKRLRRLWVRHIFAYKNFAQNFFFSLKVIEYLEVQCHDHATGCIWVLSAVNALRNLLITRLFACLKISFSLFGKSLFLVNGDNRNVCHLRKRKSVVYSSYR